MACSIKFISDRGASRPRKFCGLECSSGYINLSRKKYPFNRQCKNCKNDFVITKSGYTNQFCNKKCSAAHNNKLRPKPTDKQKSKTSLTLKVFYGTENDPPKFRGMRKLKQVIIKSCLGCNLDFESYANGRKTCSDNCLIKVRQAISLKGGRSAAAKSVKRSKDEICLYELCKNKWLNATHNEVIKDGWDADIVMKDEKIAILWSGPWYYKQLNMSNHSLLQVQTRDKIKTELFQKNGWRVFAFEDRYYTPESAFELLIYLVNP